MKVRSHRAVTDEDIEAIKRATRAHERSILRRLAGLSVRGAAGHAIDRELEARGITGPAELPTDSSKERP